MYLLIFIIPVLLVLFCINHWRKKRNIARINAMCMEDKCKLLNELVEPFGYAYIPTQDIFTSRIDAWQRSFGYSAFYDKVASRFSMVFDSLPIYFDYQGKTWLLEFWKGQYGINTGCEIGLYYADRILEEKELDYTHFQAVEDADMLRMSFQLIKNESISAQLSANHWWLTAFKVGCFSHPSQLCLHVSISFPTAEMANTFVNGLMNAGYSPEEICLRCNTITFSFSQSYTNMGILSKLRVRIAQWFNRFWCKVYLFITRPFCLSVDRILYLYFYLPFAFRKTLRIRKNRKFKHSAKSHT